MLIKQSKSKSRSKLGEILDSLPIIVNDLDLLYETSNYFLGKNVEAEEKTDNKSHIAQWFLYCLNIKMIKSIFNTNISFLMV